MPLRSFFPSFLFIVLCCQISAQQVSIDTIAKWVIKGNCESIKELVSKGIKSNQAASESFENTILLACCYYGSGEIERAEEIADLAIAKSFVKDKYHEQLGFLFGLGNKFILRKDIFEFINELGIRCSRIAQESFAEFSFYQQLISMQQIGGTTEKVPGYLNELNRLSESDSYMRYLSNFMHGLQACKTSNDSCTWYFEAVLSEYDHWIGKDNSNFLIDPELRLQRDSSFLASGIIEYAKYHNRLGNLKKTGSLLVLASNLIPQGEKFAILRIQNQISLALVYADLVNPSMALDHIQKAIDLAEEFGLERLRKTTIAAAYGYVLMSNKQYTEANQELMLAYKEFPRSVHCTEPKKVSLQLAMNDILMKNARDATSWIDSSASFDCKPDKEITFWKEFAEAIIAGQKGNETQYRAKFTNAYLLSQELHAPGKYGNVLNQLYLTEKSNGHLSQSIEALEKLTFIRDSLYKVGQEVAMLEIEAKHQRSLQDLTIKKLGEENIVQRASLASQKKALIIILIALAAFAILIALLIRAYRQIKTSNGRLSELVQQKNILLKEIHHRVKNNLQVISSLLKLQSGYVKDEIALQAIADGRSRVQSMALLHQNLYKEDHITSVNMQEYFTTLIHGLFDTYSIEPDRIVLQSNVEPLILDIDLVVPLGLITNELISNALKHAYKDDKNGKLIVNLFSENDDLILEVKDSGNTATTSWQNPGFGTKLIQTLTDKLEGEMTYSSDGGTKAVLRINNFKKAA